MHESSRPYWKCDDQEEANALPAIFPLLATVAAIAVIVASAATAVAAVTAATAAAVTAATSIGLRFGFIDNHSASLKFISVQGGNGITHGIGGIHGDECETSGPSGFTVGWNEYFSHFAMGTEQIPQVLFSGIEGQIPYVHFCVHMIKRQVLRLFSNAFPKSRD